MDRKLIWGGIALLAILSLSAGILLLTRKPSFHGSVIEPPLPAPGIRLTDSNNQPFDLGNQRGKVVLIYFGYTNCPDECPLTMAKLKLAMDSLGKLSSNVQVIMVTTDPARDDPAQLKKYVTQFNPSFLGLTGTSDELQAVYKGYGVAADNNGQAHTTFLYVIDPAGNLRLTFIGPEMNPQDVADDAQALLKGY